MSLHRNLVDPPDLLVKWVKYGFKLNPTRPFKKCLHISLTYLEILFAFTATSYSKHSLFSRITQPPKFPNLVPAGDPPQVTDSLRDRHLPPPFLGPLSSSHHGLEHLVATFFITASKIEIKAM